MSNPRSPRHYSITPRQHEDPSRKFPWDEPDFDPQKVLAHLDGRPFHREQRSREDPEDRWRAFHKADIDGPGFRGNLCDPYPDKLGHRRQPPPPLFPDLASYGKRDHPPHRDDGRVNTGRGREDFRDQHSISGGRSRGSPQWPPRERLPSSGSNPREGWRRAGQGRSQERPRDHSPRAPDRQGRGEERSPERSDTQGSHMERHEEDSYRDRSPISSQHRRDVEGHVHPGYEKEEAFRDRPRDGSGKALGDVRGLKRLVVEHEHGITNNQGPPRWDTSNGGRQHMEQHSGPRQMGVLRDHGRSSNNTSEPWEEGREMPSQDGRGDPGREFRRGPMRNNGTDQPGKFPPQKGQDNFRGRMGANHDGKWATSPIGTPPQFPQEHQEFDRQEFPHAGRKEFPHAGRKEFPHAGRKEFPHAGRKEFPLAGHKEFPREGRQEFPHEGRQEFPREGRQEFPREGRQEFPREGRQEFPREGRQEFPRDGRQDFPLDGRPEFPREGRQEFPHEGRQEFPHEGRQEFHRGGRQEFPRQGRKRQHSSLDHKEFNQGQQGQAGEQNEDGQKEPGWGKDSKPHMERSTMLRIMDPVAPSQRREHGWKNQQVSSEVVVVSEETLTIKVDMNRPVSKNSALCYSTDRQLSLDLVNVGRQRLDFLPMMQHSGTYRENTVHSGTFAQEIITLVHQVKEQYFRGNTVSLNERFSVSQDGGLEDKPAAEDQQPTLNRRFTMTMNTQLLPEPLLALQLEPLEPMRDPDDLRNNLERRRQERTEGVKITIAGGSQLHGAPGAGSEPAAMFGAYAGFGGQEEEGREFHNPQGPRNLRFQGRGGAPQGRNAGRFGNRLGPRPQ